MLITFDGHPYEMIFGSDAQRDGVYLELRDLAAGTEVAILDAFRWDADGRVTVSAYRQDIPLEIVDWFIDEVRRQLAPSIDAANAAPGTPPSRPAG